MKIRKKGEENIQQTGGEQFPPLQKGGERGVLQIMMKLEDKTIPPFAKSGSERFYK